MRSATLSICVLAAEEELGSLLLLRPLHYAVRPAVLLRIAALQVPRAGLPVALLGCLVYALEVPDLALGLGFFEELAQLALVLRLRGVEPAVEGGLVHAEVSDDVLVGRTVLDEGHGLPDEFLCEFLFRHV